MKRFASIIYKLVLALVVCVLVFLVFVFAINKIYGFYLENKYPLNYKEAILENSSKFGLDPSLVSAVIYEESRFRPESNSDKGAVGLMQVLPETAQYIAKKTEDKGFKEEDLSNPETNIKYGCYYLSYLYGRYGDIDTVLAAYNAGEGNVDAWLKEDRYQVKFEETRGFIEKVRNSQKVYQGLYFSKE